MTTGGSTTPGGGPTPGGAPTAASTGGPTSAPAGETLEVTGIIGAVNLSARVIEIKPLQGATIQQIVIDTSTVLRKAGGGTAQLRDLKSSDRIIASGKLNDRRDALIATEITVQDVLPGAQPGG